MGLRFRVYLVEEPTAILAVEDAGEAPWLVLHWLNVLDLEDQDVAWLSGLDLERAGQVVDLGQVNRLHVVRAVIVADLTARPVDAFDLDDFVVFDGSVDGVVGVPAVL